MGTSTNQKSGRKARQELLRKKKQRDRMKFWVVVGVGVLVFVGVGFAAFAGSQGRAGNGSVEAFDLPRLNGDGRVALADFEGKPTVVNLFASWCTACDAELPGFARVSEEFRDEIHWVGVASLDNGDELLMPTRHGVDWWPVGGDVGSSRSSYHDNLRLPGMPGTAFYDADGTIVEIVPTGLSESTLRSKIAQHYGIVSGDAAA